MKSILDTAKSHLRHTFDNFGQEPTQNQLKALEDLLSHLDKMAQGQLKPVYYVSSLDPGMGKTIALSSYLKALVEVDESQSIGVIVGFYRKVEIEAVVEASGLPKDRFSVLTSDPLLNELGSEDPQNAQVLFTTQQRLQLLCRNRTFAEVSLFHFKGHPRAVRVWDEAFMPSYPICLSRDDLLACIRLIRSSFPAQADKLEELLADIGTKVDGEIIQLETMYSAFSLDIEGLLKEGWSLDAEAIRILTELRLAGGQKAVIRKPAENQPHYIVTYADNLPNDLAPLLILDASARVRGTYKLWTEKRNTLSALERTQKNYEKLKVHLWSRGASRSSVNLDPQLFADAIAALISEANENHKWLIVLRKFQNGSNDANLEALVKARLSEDKSELVSFLTWGQHTATNDFSSYNNVILVGSLYLADPVTEAHYRAAGDISADNVVSPEDLTSFSQGEVMHHTLQAACRIGVRRGSRLERGEYHLYVISAARHNLRQNIKRLFPGCRLIAWTPVEKPLPKREQALVDYVVANLSKEPGSELRYKNIGDALGIGSSQQLNALRGRPKVIEALDAMGIEPASRGQRTVGYRYKIQ